MAKAEFNVVVWHRWAFCHNVAAVLAALAIYHVVDALTLAAVAWLRSL